MVNVRLVMDSEDEGTFTGEPRNSLPDGGRTVMGEAPALILAPIRGITDAVYRDAVERCFRGFDRAVAPFLLLKQGQALRPVDLKQLAPAQGRRLRTIPQVLTNHAATFSAALRELHDAGHTEVNWNLGCPYPTAAGRGRGAGLLPHPDRVDAILSAVMPSAPLRVSVKMRLGYHDPDDYAAVIEVLNRYPLAEVALHARTADQMYGGEVDVERAAQALALCRHPFVYNGDITSRAGFLRLRQQLPGAAGWMIGRGGLANPFLAAELKGFPAVLSESRRTRLREFHDLLYEGYGRWLSGPAHRLDRMREHWSYLALSFAHPEEVVTRIRRCRQGEAYASAVQWIWERDIAGSGLTPS